MQTKRGKGRKGSALYSFAGVEFDQLKRVRVWTKNTRLREGGREREEREEETNIVEQGVNEKKRWCGGRARPNEPF